MINKELTNEVSLQIKKTLVNFVAPLIALGITLALGALVIYPLINKIAATKIQIADNESKITNLQSKVAIINKLQDYNSVVTEDIGLVDTLLETSASVPRVLDETQKIAVESGITIDTLSFSDAGKAPVGTPDPNAAPVAEVPYNIVNVTFGGAADYDKIITFLQNSENAARIINVGSFRFAVGTNTSVDSSKVDVLDATFSLESPYLTTQPVAAVDVPITLDITNAKFVAFMNKLKGFKYYEFSPNSTFITDVAQQSSGSIVPAAQ